MSTDSATRIVTHGVRHDGNSDRGPRTVSLYHGDCLQVMDRIQHGSVDVVVADHPYGITACGWDSPVSLARLWPAYARVLKPRGVVVMSAVQPFASVLITSKPEWFRHEWIWEKFRASNPLQSARQPLRAHENILIFSDRPGCYRPQMEFGFRPVRGFIGDYPKQPSKSRYGGRSKGDSVYTAPRITRRDNPEGSRHPTTMLRCRRDPDSWHPTQKPVTLLRYLIRTYSRPGETVLDNVMGSGSTGVAAVREGRSFIGIEKDTDYFRRAADRIQMQTAWSFEEWTVGIHARPSS